MQKKYSKHFIYKWLKEDLFAEFMLYKKRKTVFSRKLFRKIWRYMILNWKSSKRIFLTRRYYLGGKEQKYFSYLYRKHAIVSGFLKITNYAFDLSKISSFLPHYWSALYNSRKLSLVVPDTKNLLFRNILKNRAVKNKLKSQLLKKSSYRRVSPASRYFKLSSWVYFSRLTLCHLFLTTDNNFEFPPIIKKTLKKKWVRRRRKKHTLVNTRRYFLTRPILYNRSSKSISPKLSLVKQLLYLRSWNTFIHVVKYAQYWIGKPKNKRNFGIQRRNVNRGPRRFIPVFHYSGTFKPRKRLVKRGEKKSVLNFRLLQYFNFVETARDFNQIANSYYYPAKQFLLPSLTKIEFQLPTVILRAGFLENGYVTSMLAKRKSFLVNGVPSLSNTALNLWDIITVAKPIWWLIYARYLHFFSKILRFKRKSCFSLPINKSKFLNNFIFRSLKKSFYLKRRRPAWRIRHNLWLKFGSRARRTQERRLLLTRRFLSSRNYVLALPPAYMEVSFKLFLIVLWRFVLSPNEITRPFNLHSVRSLISNNNKKSRFIPSQVGLGVGKI